MAVRAWLSALAATALAFHAPVSLAQQAGGSAAVDSGQLEEILITAQKRTEKLEDVPVAASVLSAEALAQANVSDISDVNKLVPSVQLNGTINGRVPMGIRGISSVSNEGTVGISSGVAIQVDGVPVPSDSYDGNDIMDVQSIEVLKGPQATLGGRTAASGVINLVTRGPTDALAGNVSTTFTDDGEIRVNAFVSGPLTDKIEGSLAAYHANIQYPITNLHYASDTVQEIEGFRAKLKFLLTDNVDLTLMAHLAQDRSDGFNFVYIYVPPGAVLIGSPQSTALPGITPSWHNLDYRSPVTSAGAVHKDQDASVILNYRFGNGSTLTSTSAYQREKQRQVQDIFAVDVYYWNVLTPNGPPFGPPFFNTQSQNETVTQSSEEIKLVSALDQPVSYLLGAFYSDTKVDELYIRELPPAQYDVRPIPDTATYDVYGRATWKFLPSSSLVAGVRFNHDALSYKYAETINVVSFPTAIYGPLYSTGSSSSSVVVGDISLQQKFSDSAMAYVSYARGYSPEAYNTSAVLYPQPGNPNAAIPLQPVGQEHINHFELGSKGTYLDRTLLLNVDLFDTIYQHYQIQTYAAVANVLTPPLDLTSAGKAETRGVELDTQWAATPTTRINFSAAYIDATFKDYRNAPCWGQPGGIVQSAAQGCTPVTINGTVQGVQNVDGKTMPNSPKFKAIAGFEQRVPLSGVPDELLFGADYSYRTSAQMLVNQNPWAVQGAFGILNLHAGFQTNSGRFSVTAFLNNVTNKVYYVDVEDFWTGPWGGPAVIGQPARDARRFAGVRLSASL
ncbi:MAG TPA: TonB-dependent receptor [Steroidobacteraceae bacterium]|nr:TonB-dependent receptor [Steroidobacteraceae bacterium]